MKAIHTILHDHLSVRKLCSRWIPHNLTEAQKQARVKWSKEMLKKFNRGRSNLVYNIVTGDETWIYSYELKSKQNNLLFGKKIINNWRLENNNGERLKKDMFAPLLKKTVYSIDLISMAKNGFQTCGLYPLHLML
ncbi:hypothetical protein ALC56_10566 [Trachymyrmex septentrionalis]|uniref:Uncharacterized protein n=1 Tax=Trachymyrmex septentrionalis TaxID=34720 RepID=A0A195F3Y2_9HYME|nr:hypothetical protein ALC56_10566 [Trachymyrmex septentrionalis]